MRSFTDIISRIYEDETPDANEIINRIGAYPPRDTGAGSFLQEIADFYIQWSYITGCEDTIKRLETVIAKEIKNLDAAQCYSICKALDIEADSLIQFIMDREETTDSIDFLQAYRAAGEKEKAEVRRLLNISED